MGGAQSGVGAGWEPGGCLTLPVLGLLLIVPLTLDAGVSPQPHHGFLL